MSTADRVSCAPSTRIPLIFLCNVCPPRAGAPSIQETTHCLPFTFNTLTFSKLLRFRTTSHPVRFWLSHHFFLAPPFFCLVLFKERCHYKSSFPGPSPNPRMPLRTSAPI